MKLFFSALLIAFSSLNANAHNFHSENFCSATDATLCAHIGYDEVFTSEKAYEFVFHVTSPKANLMENVRIELWMDMGNGHGHGSAPVSLNNFGPGKFEVTEAYFVMMGEWQIKADFTIEGQAHQIIIPVQIQR